MSKLNLNADFLLDIWADLKAKKLAPVAIALVAAAVVMPAVMLTGGDEVPAGPLPIVPAPAADTAEVQLAQELADGDSKLDSYKARNPFDGLVKPGAGGGDASGTAIAPSDTGTGTTSGGDPAMKSVTGGGDLSLSFGGDDGSSPSPGSGGGLTGGNPNPPTVVRKPGARYTYTLDVKFGRPGRETRYRNLERMSFLPNADVPALLFMGVPVAAKSAIFFVHPTLSHAGEGDCMPSKSKCNFLELAIGREHFLSVEDLEFRIQLLDVNKVKLSDQKRESVRKTSGSRRSARGIDNPLTGDSADRPLPWLVDGIG